MPAYNVVAHSQRSELDVDLRHGRQQIGDAGTLFLCVDANMDRNWPLLFLHSLYGFSSSLLNASWHTYLPQVMITGGPHPHLTNFHGFLTNLVRRPSMLLSVGLSAFACLGPSLAHQNS
jgi:hypothetical protein